MKTRAEILKEVADDSYYREYCRGICKYKEVWQDLYQYTMLCLSELKEEKIQEISRRTADRPFGF